MGSWSIKMCIRDSYDSVTEGFGTSEGLALKGKSIADEIARIIVNKMISTELTPHEFITKVRTLLTPIQTDSGALDLAIHSVIAAHPDPRCV